MSDQVERGTVREMIHAIKFRAGILEDLLKNPVVGGLEVRTDELAHVRMLQQQVDDLRRYLHLPSAEPERKKGECTKINCPIQMNYISNDCDIKTCPYRTERQIGKWKNVALFTRECSKCGAQFHELEYDNFCPNCGADMRGD